MTDTKKLRRRIEEKGLKYGFIASQLGISRYALQMKIDNDSEFRVSEVDALANLLGLSLLEKDAIFLQNKWNVIPQHEEVNRMKLYGVLFVWLAAVLGCLAMRKISPGTKWYPAYAFGVCACHYRDCWYLRSLTAMVVRS